MPSKNEKPFEIIMFGPPVSGKGTQAKLLSDTFAVPHISTGDLLRAIKSDPNNPFSKEIAETIDAGKLVSDEFISKIVANKLEQDECNLGYVLDGYPRTRDQVDFLEGIADVDYVFLVEVPDEVVIERISGRRMCKNGHTWHIKYSPTKEADICDACGEALYIRDDDTEARVRDRLTIYHLNNDPILDFYSKQGKLIRVNGDQHIEKVFQQIIKQMVNDLRSNIGWE